jgi:hypothetical protein
LDRLSYLLRDWLSDLLRDWLCETLRDLLRDWLCETLRDRLRDWWIGHRGLWGSHVRMGGGRGTRPGVALAGSAHQVGDDSSGVVGVGVGA